MKLLTPIVPNAEAPLARANPVAKVVAALALLVVLFASLDGVTALIVLAGLACALPLSGLSPSALLGRAWLLGLAAVSIGVANILFAPEQLGTIVLAVGPVRIGGTTLLDGLGLAVRLIAIAATGVLAITTSQPTEIADSLIQQLHASPRFAIGTLAALRLLPLLAEEWQTIGMARRARGVDAGRSPLATVSLFAGQLMGLLVGAIRRGSRMALAMEARGFGATECRSVARVERVAASDLGWVAAAICLAGVALGVSVALGTWRPLLG
jgi:energy-coupling factor transport system permease protein